MYLCQQTARGAELNSYSKGRQQTRTLVPRPGSNMTPRLSDRLSCFSYYCQLARRHHMLIVS